MIDHYVPWFDIAVNHSQPGLFSKPFGDLYCDVDYLADRKRFASYFFCKRLAFYKFTHNEVDAPRIFDFMDCNDVRMVDCGGRPRFQLKTLYTVRIPGEGFRKEF